MMREAENVNSMLVEVEKILTELGPRSERPQPALVDGKPIVVSMLSDGRPVLAAADRLGNPWKDGKGDYVVIDPQTGDTRFKLPRKAEQSMPRIKYVDQLI